MEDAARGKKALEASKYNEAIKHYTSALKDSPTSPDYLIQRSTAHLRAKDYAAALTDANQAVIYAQKRAKREAIVESQFRRGCALYNLERYGDALFAFELVKKKDDKHKSVTMWLTRSKNSMDKLDAGDERRKCNINETPDVEANPRSSNAATTSASTPTAPTSQPAAAPAQTPADKIRHEWYQNTTHVYFTLFAKGVPKDKAQIDIQERSLSISFPIGTDSSYDFTLEPLFAAVDPSKCDPRVMSTKVEVVLAKATPGQKWSALESKEPITNTTSTSNGSISTNDAVRAAVLAPTTSGPAYPTSSKTGPKNWDKVVADANKSTSDSKKGGIDDDDYEGGDEANFFFKKLYKDSSPEVQRAMMKSFTESNGTALSTDWGEVSKGKVETVPPDGMEAKGWEK